MDHHSFHLFKLKFPINSTINTLSMKSKFLYILIGSILVFLLYVLIPRNWSGEPYKKLPGHYIWKLSSGSMINYYELTPSKMIDSIPILYLHGGPGGCISPFGLETFRKLSQMGYKIFLYDQLGSGGSSKADKISDYSVERHTKDLTEIIDKIAAPKVNIIAQSWGSLLLCNYLTTQHMKINKIIFTGPGSILPLDRSLRNIESPDSLQLSKPMVSNADGNRKMSSWRISIISWSARVLGWKLASDQEMDAYFYNLNIELNKSTYCDSSNASPGTSGGGYYAHVMTVNSFSGMKDHKKSLKNCNFPALIMRGQCDNQPWGFTTEYLKLFPNIQLKIIPEAGHSIAAEQPELYLKTLIEFLKN